MPHSTQLLRNLKYAHANVDLGLLAHSKPIGVDPCAVSPLERLLDRSKVLERTWVG
jgi:hypothetical protein